MRRTFCERFEAALPALLVFICLTVLFVAAVNFEPTRRWVCYGYAVNESCVRRLLYDFQTLITGIAAVGAAALTVWTMQSTDRRQQQRHDHLVALNLRTEYLTLERAIVPFLDELRGRAELASSLHRKVMELEPGVGEAVWSEAQAIEEAIWATQEALETDEMIAALRYFDGATNRTYKKLLEAARLGGYAANRIATKSRDPQSEPEDVFDYWFEGMGGDGAGYDTIVWCLDHLVAAYPPFLERLEGVKNRLEDVRARYPNVI